MCVRIKKTMNFVRKYNLIKNLTISLIALAIFLLPVSPNLNIKKSELALIPNLALADTQYEKDFTGTVSLDTRKADYLTSGSVDFTFTIKSNRSGAFLGYAYKEFGNYMDYLNQRSSFSYETSTSPDFKDNFTTSSPTWKKLGYGDLDINNKPTVGTINDTAGGTVTNYATWSNFKANTLYYARISMKDKDGNWVSISPAPFSFTTLKEGEGSSPKGVSSDYVNPSLPLDLGCSVVPTMDLTGCFAEFFHIIWLVTALIMHLGGSFLDFLIYYSTDSASYSNGFVQSGWGVVRDVANIFFIVALVFIAIKTVLSINVTNNKRLIGYILIVGLLINFSLFLTQVVVDSSNILAKVFYNNIDAKDQSGQEATGNKGQKSISEALASKFNPQTMMDQGEYDDTGGTTKYILITLALIAIGISTALMFFTVALLFVVRTVGLYVAMIFAPIAFISFALPFKIPGDLGHEKWMANLFSGAFLAPVFVFFLYIIIMFAGILGGDLGSKGIGVTGSGWLEGMITTLVPFVILFVLIMKAKSLAVSMSGEFGAKVANIGKGLGNLVVGSAVTGGIGLAAAGGRATLGKWGKKIGESDWAKTNGRFGRMVGDAGKFVGKSSFDARGIKMVGGALAGSGLAVGGVLAAKKGGYQGQQSRKIQKRQERAKSLEVGSDSDLIKTMKQNQADLQAIKTMTNAELEKVGKSLTLARQTLQDEKAGADGSAASNQRIKDAKQIVDAHVEEISDIKNATGAHEGLKVNGKSQMDAERSVIDSGHAIAVENKRRKTEYAEEELNNVFMDQRTKEEAQHKIIMEAKIGDAQTGSTGEEYRMAA